MLPLRKALDFAHSERHNFVPMVVYSLYTHTIHIPLLLCSCKSDEGHASFCQRRRENERLAFIHNSEVGSGGWGRGGGHLVRKEMSCYRVMTMLAWEHLWQHQRASNYNQFPLQTTSKTLHSSIKLGCQRSLLPLRWQPGVDSPGELVCAPSLATISMSLC